MPLRLWTLVPVALLAVGCEDEGSATMRPGEDCQACHSAEGSDREEAFSAAGTVTDGKGNGLSGITVVLTDRTQTTRTTSSNSVGNFFFRQSLTPPLTVKLTQGSTVRLMLAPAASGACNSCHRAGGAAGAGIAFP